MFYNCGFLSEYSFLSLNWAFVRGVVTEIASILIAIVLQLQMCYIHQIEGSNFMSIKRNHIQITKKNRFFFFFLKETT